MIEESTQQKPLVIPLADVINMPNKEQLLILRTQLSEMIEEIGKLKLLLKEDEE